MTFIFVGAVCLTLPAISIILCLEALPVSVDSLIQRQHLKATCILVSEEQATLLSVATVYFPA